MPAMPDWVWGVLFAAFAAVCMALIATARLKFSARRMTSLAMLTALYVALSLVATLNLWWIRISVDSLPILVAAMLFGPAGGMLVGLLGSFLNQLLTYGLTATTVLWILPAAVRGLLVGVAVKYCKKLTALNTCLIFTGSALLTTVINTGVMYVDSIVGGYYTKEYVFGGLLTRLGSGVLIALVMSFAVPPLANLLRPVLGDMREEKK